MYRDCEICKFDCLLKNSFYMELHISYLNKKGSDPRSRPTSKSSTCVIGYKLGADDSNLYKNLIDIRPTFNDLGHKP